MIVVTQNGLCVLIFKYNLSKIDSIMTIDRRMTANKQRKPMETVAKRRWALVFPTDRVERESMKGNEKFGFGERMGNDICLLIK
jgi:hypothetical protein